MRENSKITKRMEEEFLKMQRVKLLKANGKMDNTWVKEARKIRVLEQMKNYDGHIHLHNQINKFIITSRKLLFLHDVFIFLKPSKDLIIV